MSDLEKKLLAKMTSQAEIQRVWEQGIRSEVFEDPVNRLVFEWMIDYWIESQMLAAPTWVALETKFPSVQIDTDVEETTGFLIEHLKQRYSWNQLQRLLIDHATDEAADDPIKATNNLWRTAYDVAEVVAPRNTRSNMADNVAARRQRYARREQQPDGLPLGFPELDEHTRGLLPGELAAVVAYTKTGKTWWLVQAAVAALRAGYTPLIMTLEQRIEEMEDRIDAVFSGVSYQAISQTTLTVPQSLELRAAQDRMAALGNVYVEKPQRGERTVKNMTSRCRQLGADYLIIDQLSFVDAEREYHGDKATTAKHGDLIFDLKDEINRDSVGLIPCMLAVQMNRQGGSRDGGRGEMFNIANSSMIEQTVDIALGLWRTPEMRTSHAMGIDIMGSRRSDLKSWIASWHLTERTEFLIREENDG